LTLLVGSATLVMLRLHGHCDHGIHGNLGLPEVCTQKSCFTDKEAIQIQHYPKSDSRHS
jgi:hypothetical protein